MRPRIDWMTQADERILEFLSEKDIISSPGVIAANLGYNSNYISRRCRKLADAELIQRTDATNYQITELGERYLSGRLSQAEIKELEEDLGNRNGVLA